MPSETQKMRGWLLPDDFATIENAPLIAFCGLIPDTPETRAALRGTVERLSQWFNWDKSYTPGDTRARDTAQYMRQLLFDHFTIGDCNMAQFRLRQNPLNPCLLEQSLDGGETWTVAFNYGLCSTGTSGSNDLTDAIFRLSELVDEYEALLDQYANDPNYVPDNITQADDPLCWTIVNFVDLLCQAVLEYRKKDTQGMQLAGALLGVVVGVVSVALGIATVGIFGIIAMTLASAVAELAATAWDNVSDGLLNNADAKQKVVCCMYNALTETTPTRATLLTSLDNCGFSDPLSNEEQLRGAIVGSLANTDIQVAFFELLSQAITGESGLPATDCTCAWCYTWDFAAVKGSWVAREGSGIDRAVWVSGIGWKSNQSNSNSRDEIIIQYDTGTAFSLTKATLTFTNFAGENPVSNLRDTATVRNSETVTATVIHQPASEMEITTGLIVLSNYVNNGALWDAVLTSVTLEGTGVNPFGSSNCEP